MGTINLLSGFETWPQKSCVCMYVGRGGEGSFEKGHKGSCLDSVGGRGRQGGSTRFQIRLEAGEPVP